MPVPRPAGRLGEGAVEAVGAALRVAEEGALALGRRDGVPGRGEGVALAVLRSETDVTAENEAVRSAV